MWFDRSPEVGGRRKEILRPPLLLSSTPPLGVGVVSSGKLKWTFRDEEKSDRGRFPLVNRAVSSSSGKRKTLLRSRTLLSIPGFYGGLSEK